MVGSAGPPSSDSALHHAGFKVATAATPEAGEKNFDATLLALDGHNGTEQLKEELQMFVRQKLAKHEVPREIEFVTSLPMTTTGKIMRKELRQREVNR